MSDPGRRAGLADRLGVVHDEVARAAERSGRAATEINVVVVTKTWPVGDLRTLYSMGVREFGESRHQEAVEKSVELEGLGVVWHFIGQIQSNKAARIAAYADVVHSVDSLGVAQRLSTGADRHERTIDCLIQVNLDETVAQGRGGVREADVHTLAQAVDTASGLRLLGVMGVAPQHQDPRSAYRQLAVVSQRLRQSFPEADAISAGMSDDFPVAIEEGATHVRVGSAILGQRPPLR